MKAVKEILAQAEAFLQELPPAPQALAQPKGCELAAWIDHTLLKPEATAEQVAKLCAEAREHHFATVCVNPGYVKLASGLLAGSGAGVCSVVAFPLGATLPELKAIETRKVIEWGATEIDMVINIGALKGGSYPLALEDIIAVVEEAHTKGAQVKVILEMALLNQREKIIGCLLSKAASADFVKTSTGFGPGGATAADVELMRRVVGAGTGVKAAGGIRSLADARAMIAVGANRLGASASISILQEAG
jgi:deoxyribose-phosphate aldolase